jgi:hypothetical protein
MRTRKLAHGYCEGAEGDCEVRVRVKMWHNYENEDKCGLDELDRVGFVSEALVWFRAEMGKSSHQ